jgi:hypothetical protein
MSALRAYLIGILVAFWFVGWPGAGEAPAAGTFMQINDPLDPHVSWSSPRINNVGHVVLLRVNTSNYGGNPFLWTGDWSTKTAYPGASVGNVSRGRPRIQINDNDVIATTDGNEHNHLYNTSGEISLAGSPVNLNYAIDINNADQISSYSAYGATGRIYWGDASYTTMNHIASSYLVTSHVAQISESGHVLYKYGATLNRYHPDTGVQAVASISSSNVDIDAAGNALYHVGDNSVVHQGVVVRQSAGMQNGNNNDGQLAVSDNGRHVVWTENYGDPWKDWDLWTLVDGMPMNLTQGAYGTVYNPDVNNDGTIVFAGADPNQLWSGSYASDIWMYTDLTDLPLVYNGHFNGQTLFGWQPITDGAATVDLVQRAANDYCAQLTSGSAAEIQQVLLDIESPGSGILSFDVDFGDSAGTLTVMLDDVVVAVLTEADDTEVGFTTIELAGTADAQPLLRFIFDSPTPGSTVQIDNIVLIPEPAALCMLSLGALLMLRRRR